MKRLPVVFALALFACDSEDPKPGPIEPDPDAADALDAMFVAACERQVECGYPVFGPETTVDACLAVQRAATGEVPTQLGGGAVVLDASRLATCTAAIEAASCSAIANERLEIDPSCTSYWRGTIEVGEACMGGVVTDCVDGARCAFPDETCPGTCTAIEEDCVEGGCGFGEFCNAFARCAPRAVVGATCDYVVEGALVESSCVDGAFCADGTCVTEIAAGEVCEGSTVGECTAGYYCGCSEPSCAVLRCVPTSAEGDECNQTFQCADGLYCDFASNTCGVRKDAGATCDDSFGMCGPGLVCSEGRVCTDPNGIELPARELAAVGELCSGKICASGSSCQCADDDCKIEEKVCTLGPALGEDCGDFLNADYSPFVCREGVCDILGSLKCVQPAAPGAACEGDQTFACGGFLCIDGTCATLEETRCDAILSDDHERVLAP